MTDREKLLNEALRQALDLLDQAYDDVDAFASRVGVTMKVGRGEATMLRALIEAAPGMELFVDGAGKHVQVHERTQDCIDNHCCIHNPSDHPLKDAPLIWRVAHPLWDFKPSHMERFCEHEVGHPDPDSLAFLRRTGKAELADTLAIHGCDGCCS